MILQEGIARKVGRKQNRREGKVIKMIHILKSRRHHELKKPAVKLTDSEERKRHFPLFGSESEELSQVLVLKTDAHYVIFIVPESQKIEHGKIESEMGVRHVHSLSKSEIRRRFPEYLYGIDFTMGSEHRVPVYCHSRVLQHNRFWFESDGYHRIMSVPMRDLIKFLSGSKAKLVL